jgi:hypothetical protein
MASELDGRRAGRDDASMKRGYVVVIALALTSCAARESDGSPRPSTSASAGPTGGCASDADCSYTMIDEKTCCDRCDARALLRSDLDRLSTDCRSKSGRECPLLDCPNNGEASAICDHGTCIVAYKPTN